MSYVARNRTVSAYTPYFFCDGCGAKWLVPRDADIDKESRANYFDESGWREGGMRHFCKSCTAQAYSKMGKRDE